MELYFYTTIIPSLYISSFIIIVKGYVFSSVEFKKSMYTFKEDYDLIKNLCFFHYKRIKFIQ